MGFPKIIKVSDYWLIRTRIAMLSLHTVEVLSSNLSGPTLCILFLFGYRGFIDFLF